MKMRAVVLVVMLSTLGYAAKTAQDMSAALDRLQVKVNNEVTQDVEVVNAVAVAIAPQLSATVGRVEAAKGSSINLPVYFKASSSQTTVSGVQFDVAIATGLTVTGVEPGIAALAAQKGVQAAPVTGGMRIIVFGINTTAISSGPIVVLKINVAANALVGKRPVLIGSLAASSPIGTGVTLTGRAGYVTVK